ncbi:MAG: hypothetical protein P4L53_18315 [Candidatus Obscuribacterales bacterium]|nr:hypothetical protein [Candidatus Obscuribacterales bacterium]
MKLKPELGLIVNSGSRLREDSSAIFVPNACNLPYTTYVVLVYIEKALAMRF